MITLQQLLDEAELNYRVRQKCIDKYLHDECEYFKTSNPSHKELIDTLVKEHKKQYATEIKVYKRLLKKYFDYDYEIPELKESE